MEDENSYKVSGAAIEVRKTLGGPRLLEGSLGLLINFGNERIKEGISRIVNGL